RAPKPSADTTEDIAARVKKNREEIEQLREEVERSEERAREELQRAREEQTRVDEFEERYRAYVMLEPVVRAEQLFIIERFQREIPRLLTETEKAIADVRELKETVRGQVESFARRIDMRDKPKAARSDAHGLFVELQARRERERARAESLAKLLQVVRSHERSVQQDLIRVRKQSEALQTAARNSDDKGRQKAAAFAESVHQRLKGYNTLLRRRERLYAQQAALAAAEVTFAKQSQNALVELLPSEPRRDLWRLNEANIREARGELRDLVIEARQLVVRRRKQLFALPSTLVSLAGVGWLLKALLLVSLLVMTIRHLRRNREAWIERALAWVMDRQGRRTHAQALATGLEVLSELLDPAALWLALELVVAVLAEEPTPPLVVGIAEVLRAALMYQIASRALSALALPGWFRQMTPERQARELLNPERGPRLRRNQFLVETVRLLLLYTVACQTTLVLVRSALGMFFLGYWIHWVGYLGYAVVIYLLLSRWRQTISALFTELAHGRRAVAAATFVEEHKDRSWGLFVIFGAFVYVLVREVWNLVRGWLLDQSWIRRLSNFVFRRQVEMGSDAEPSSHIQGSIEALPSELRTMFRDLPLKDTATLIELPIHIQLAETVAAWRSGAHHSAWVVVGEQGMGKTTALYQVQRLLHDSSSVHWWDMPTITRADRFSAALASKLGLDEEEANPADEHALIQALLAMEPSVVLLDDVHQLLMREVGGFGAIELLQRLWVTTGHHHLWVVAIDAYAWALLQRMHNRPLRPPNVLWLDPWGADDLRRLVDARMDPLACKVTFERLGLDDDDFEDEWSLFDQSAGGYFRLLEESARGNPRCAMRLWQESLVRDDEGVFHVHLFSAPPRERMHGLTDTDRFVLAALVQHVSLTIPELARTTALELNLVSAHLLGLEQLGLVVRCPDNGRARVAKPAYNQVVTTLTDFNLLHL
ncbi:MAG: AAA family ATPase, partial [Myxococcota bacterium]